MAIKFHPDKCQSTHAADTFKAISHAFTTLKDPEKKAFYDKYGSEEEYREKYHQQQHGHHDEEEMDPFDLFEMFFSGMNGNVRYQRGGNGRVFRRQQHPEEGGAQQARPQQRAVVWMQLLPFFALILFSVVPYLFSNKPYYQFFRDEEYYKKMTTSINRVDFYVGDRFIKKYDTDRLIKELHPQIERDFLGILSNQCANLIKYKNELEYKMSYYRHSHYRSLIENELRGMDFSPCDKFYKFKEKIR